MQLLALLRLLCILKVSLVLKMKDMYALGGSPGLHAALGLTGTADDPGTRNPHDKGKIIRVKRLDWPGNRVNKYTGWVLAALLTYIPLSNVGWSLERTFVSL